MASSASFDLAAQHAPPMPSNGGANTSATPTSTSAKATSGGGGGGSGGASEVLLHPVVVSNISDHFTRQVVNGTSRRVVGALLGEQRGRQVEVWSSFELVMLDDAAGVLDGEYTRDKLGQMRLVFPSYELVGWYSTGAAIADADHATQRALTELSESPLLLLLDTAAAAVAKELPLRVFEPELHIVDGEVRTSFVAAQYRIHTTPAERLATDYVSHASPSAAAGASSIPKHLGNLASAIAMLNQRVAVIVAYLEAVQRGELPHDRALLRQVLSVRHALPTMTSADFVHSSMLEYNDALLVAYLATITKALGSANDVVHKHSIASERHGAGGLVGGRRSRGAGVGAPGLI